MIEETKARGVGSVIWLAILSGCCAHLVDVDTFRQRPLAEQIREYERGRRENCIPREGGRSILLSAMSLHDLESADAMTTLLKHPEPGFPLGDVMTVLEFVHFGGTDLRGHESMRVLADLAQTASDPRVRARAKVTLERIMKDDPRLGEPLYRTRCRISNLLADARVKRKRAAIREAPRRGMEKAVSLAAWECFKNALAALPPLARPRRR